MGPLSTLLACAVHLGTIPSPTAWEVSVVAAPVAEPDVDDQVRAALREALAARRALATGGTPLTATVLEAAWTPTRRSGAALLWEARLVVLLEGGGRRVTRQRSLLVASPSDAAAARAARSAAFAELARQVAEDGVSHLLQ